MRSHITTQLLTALLVAGTLVAAPTREQVLATALPVAERGYKSATTEPPPPNLGSRDLFMHALVYCQAGVNLDRATALFDRAAQMQDTDPASRGYGNFRWYWSQTEVLDFNAVDFCMQTAALLWKHHREQLPEAARRRLRALMDLGTEGCLRHRVSPSYTNIALMNAGNLIFLGEMLGRADAAAEGYRRLENAARDIWENGVHEYNSPTYYGVDLDDLALIEALAERESGVTVARALLDLFARQTALNWFEPNQRLGGPCSRDYDYLRGLGYLHTPLWVWGWPIGREAGGSGAVPALLTRWRPDAETVGLSTSALPRLVRGKYGVSLREAWTHYVLPDVSLGSAGTCYHNMDIPLCFQLPGGHQQVRGYFIADGRHDPYGKVKIAESRGGHSKTLHLAPFWTAAQTKRDALGYVAYRAADVPEGTQTLESHIVLPRNVDSLWINEQRVEPAEKTWNAQVAPGATITLVKGTAAAGIKVLAARGCDGRDAPVTLVEDGNAFGALRLTISHAQANATGGQAGAVVWMRVGGGLADAAAFAAWRQEFAKAAGRCALSADSVSAEASGPDGDLRIEVGARLAQVKLTPAPSRAVTELDGVDIGRQRLARVEPFKSWATENERLPLVDLGDGRETTIEAESGSVRPTFVVADDAAASGGKYAWSPGEPGGKGGVAGAIRWRVKLARAARMYVFGRVITPTPDDDSFFLSILGLDLDAVEPVTWSTGTHLKWEWSPAGAHDLPAGESVLEIRVREDGAKLDKLLLTPRADLPR